MPRKPVGAPDSPILWGRPEIAAYARCSIKNLDYLIDIGIIRPGRVGDRGMMVMTKNEVERNIDEHARRKPDVRRKR